MKAHPYADKFPMLSDAELAELAESIAANGLRNPVVLTMDGLILDGRNRAAACGLLGIEPETVAYEGDDLAEYVIDCNVRRNMPTGARAMATALVLAEDGRRDNGRWRRGSVLGGGDITDSRNNWKDALRQAGLVLDHAPDLAEDVVAGRQSLNAAHQQACRARDEAAERARRDAERDAEETSAREFMEANAPDLAERVDGSDLLTHIEALDLWKRRNREEAAALAAEKAAADKAKRDHDAAMTSLYSGIARGLQICGGYGAYGDITELMAEFSTTHLHPPQYEREFTLDNLRNVRRFADMLITWQETRNV